MTWVNSSSHVKWDDISFTITVDGEVIMGDVNSDGLVDINDVTTLAQHIIGQDPLPFNASAANVNGDGEITIADVTTIINIILQ